MLPEIYKQFIQLVNPTVTLLELANSLELTLQDVYTLAMELQTLGIGKVIKVVTEDSVYKISSHVDLSSESMSCRMFTAAFPFNATELKLHQQPSWATIPPTAVSASGDSNSRILSVTVDGNRSKSALSLSVNVPYRTSGTFNGINTATNTPAPASESFHRHQSPSGLFNNNSTNSIRKPKSDELSVKFMLPSTELQASQGQTGKPFVQYQTNSYTSGSPASLEFLPTLSSRFGYNNSSNNTTPYNSTINTARHSTINTARTTARTVDEASPRSDGLTAYNNRQPSDFDNMSMKSLFSLSSKTNHNNQRINEEEYTLATGRSSWAQLSDTTTRDRVSNIALRSFGNEPSALHEVTVGSNAVFFYVLSLFDGTSTVSRYIDKLPSALRSVGLDILIWLLRFDLLEEVQISFVTIDASSSSSTNNNNNMSASGSGSGLGTVPPPTGVALDSPIVIGQDTDPNNSNSNRHVHSVGLSELLWKQQQQLNGGKLRREQVMLALQQQKTEQQQHTVLETLVMSIQST